MQEVKIHCPACKALLDLHVDWTDQPLYRRNRPGRDNTRTRMRCRVYLPAHRSVLGSPCRLSRQPHTVCAARYAELESKVG